MNDPTPATAADSPAPPSLQRNAAHADGDTCPNCGAATWGEFCFACGQPRKGLIRRFSSILGDFLDTVFSIDNRLLRTIGPLYFKPGHLTCEYVAGRRVRYVTPFRLFFFLCVFSFFTLQLYAIRSEGAIKFEGPQAGDLGAAKTPAQVDAWLAEALKGIEAGRAGVRVGMAAGGASTESTQKAEANIVAAEQKLRERAQQRKQWLADAAKATAAGIPAPPEPPELLDGEITFGNGPWDAQKNPITIGWLPDAANAMLNERAGRAKDAISHARENPQPLIEAFFAAIPPATFVLMPLFALLLKAMYLFKRRLYMEHLLTALHSHAFIFLSLLLISISLMLQEYVAAAHPWLNTAMDWMIVAMGWWIPLYLLIAQKRIYRQNWFATVFKFGVIGIAYMVLLAFGLSLAVVFGLFNL